MANLDTAAKRNSGLDHEEVWAWAAPLPDGAIGQGDRQHSVWSYSGILSAAAAATPTSGARKVYGAGLRLNVPATGRHTVTPPARGEVEAEG